MAWAHSAVAVAILLIGATMLAACSTIIRHPVPEGVLLDAVTGVPEEIRFWGDERPINLEAMVREVEAQRRAANRGQFNNANYLTLSGAAPTVPLVPGSW